MALPDIFSQEVTDELISRVKKLTPASTPLWGKMTVGQMLAHCCITYQYVYEPEKFKKPNFIMRMVLKAFVKNKVVNEIPYPKNVPTASDFIIKGDKDFLSEQARLISYLEKSQKDGASYFDGKQSFSFGPLSLKEWNNMFYKHINHHLTQFGV